MKKIIKKNEVNVDMRLSDSSDFQYREAYNSLRTNIMFSLAGTEKTSKTFAVSSPTPSDGKSTVSANLALSLSKFDKKVVIIDADLRKPRQHRFFQLPNKKGLSDIIAGVTDTDSCIYNINENLDLITAGTIPPNPSELLGSDKMRELIKKLEQKYDYVVIDTPPILIVADVFSFSDSCAGVLLVSKANKTYYKDISESVNMLKNGKVTLLGNVIVGAENEDIYKKLSGGKKGKYGYYYGDI